MRAPRYLRSRWRPTLTGCNWCFATYNPSPNTIAGNSKNLPESITFRVTIQLTSDLPDSGVKSAHIRWYTARFILVLEQIRGNLNRYQ